MTSAQTCIIIATAWLLLMMVAAYFEYKYDNGLGTYLIALSCAFCLFALVVHLLANVVLLSPRA